MKLGRSLGHYDLSPLTSKNSSDSLHIADVLDRRVLLKVVDVSVSLSPCFTYLPSQLCLPYLRQGTRMVKADSLSVIGEGRIKNWDGQNAPAK